MLKVTINQADSIETWELEGKLSGDWVKELERCWSERQSRAEMRFRIDLKAVSYIDTAGKDWLIQMYGRGAEIRAWGCMNKALVDEITQHSSGGYGSHSV